MNVPLGAVYLEGVMDCWPIRDTAAQCLQNLQPRIAMASGIGDIYVDTRCVL